MYKKLSHTLFFLAGFLMLMFALSGQSVGAAGASNCGCHPQKTQKEFVHKPVKDGECQSCHKPSGQKHPRIKKEAFLLTDKGNSGLCYECHERKDTMKYVHGPVASGDCRECHDVHQSDTKAQLKAPGGQLCFLCHDKAGFARKHPHPPVADGNCTACHDPHQTNVKYMLKGEGMYLCLNCHDKKLFEGSSVHGPVARGECHSCHATHGTDNPKLLKKYFPEELYMPFQKDNFALCFGCHSSQLADDRRTDVQTGFRNGIFNLHFTHVNKDDKGRSCKTCHDPHAAGQPRLVSNKIHGFGTWRIPIRYTKTETGGTCVVGCHKPKSYDRLTPGQ